MPYCELPSDYPLKLAESDSAGACVFRLGSDAEGLPSTWNQWLFVWGSALIGIVSAYQAGVVTQDELLSICAASDVASVRGLLDDPDKKIDDRIRLFTLYSLQRLDPKHAGAALGRLRLSDDEGRRLEKSIALTVLRLLRSDVSLIDAHLPDDVLFKRTLDPSPRRLLRYPGDPNLHLPRRSVQTEMALQTSRQGHS